MNHHVGRMHVDNPFIHVACDRLMGLMGDGRSEHVKSRPSAISQQRSVQTPSGLLAPSVTLLEPILTI